VVPASNPEAVLVALLALAGAALATAFGLLPERIDLFTLFAAYGAGRVAGELLGVAG